MRRLGSRVSVAVPHVFAGAIFLGGAMLLFAGALPAATGRLAWLSRFVPLPLIEMSHFFTSLAGAGLLLLARGLQRRLDAAYVLTLAFLAVGIVLSLAKGFDYEEAIVLTALLAALASSRRFFYRRSSLLAEPLTPRWIASIAIVLAGTAWLALFAFEREEYSSALWWQFTLNAEAPRALRAMVGAIGVAVAFAVPSAPAAGARCSHPSDGRGYRTSPASRGKIAVDLSESRFPPRQGVALQPKWQCVHDVRANARDLGRNGRPGWTGG